MAADHPLTPLLNALQSALVPPTQAAAQLPSPSDLAFERTLSRKLARSLDTESDRILTLASRVLNWASPTPGGGGAFDADLVREGVYNPTTLRLEPLLEAADDAIDRHRGTGKHARKNGPGAAGAKSAEEMKEREKDRAKRERLPAWLLHNSGLEKPQLRFTERCIMKRPKLGGEGVGGEGEDAAATVPPGEDGEGFEGIPLWKPLLRRKVNAKDEDAPWLTTEIYSPSSSYTLTTHTSPPRYIRYSHPYAAELASLSPPSSLLAKPEKTPPPHKKDSFEKTPFEWVEDEEGLARMVEEIRSAGEEGMKELAIDLEHHDFRTWGGITCLMQLSTRKKDYVIDVLNPAVRDNLDSLNEFFTDASWVKVFHGASSDIIWLQRDFGLYIVGLFDTYHATKVLGYAQHSLASLLDMYTDFEPDKRYQLADWRIRPLPQEMLHYARSDTHYLLSIYDHLRLALHSKQTSSPPDASSPFPSHLEEVFHRSTLTSSSVFSLPPFDPLTGHGDSSFLPLLAKHGQLKSYATAVAVPTLPIKTGWGPGEGKLEVLRAVCTWRERTAREEDESVRYVLGQGGVWQLAELGGIGRVRDERDVMSALGGARGGVSEVVRRRKEELAEVVVAAFKQATGAARKDGEAEGEDVEMAAATAGTAPVQLGLPAEEPTVRPVQGLWDAPVASTSAAAVSVKTAAGSAFYGASSSSSSSTFPTSASPSVATASSSSFFGTSSLSTASTSTIASSVSKGKGKGKSPASIPRQTAADRAAAVSRVHASLVLGGGLAQSLSAHTIPSAVAAAPTETDVTLPDEPLDDQPTEQTPSTDHTYVPLSGRVPKPEQPSTLDASSRAPAYSKPDKNEVIVVSSLKDKGSAGGKKRKRVVASTSSSTASSAAMPSLNSPAAVAEAEVASPPPPAPAPKKPKLKKTDRAALAASLTPHDYSSAPSILDATGVGATGRQRREMEKREKKSVQREEKGRKEREGVDTSAFGRAPRVNNAPKKANKAHVFAK